MFMGMIFPFITRVARNELGATQTMLAILSAAPFIGNLIAPIWAQHMEGKAKMPFVLGSIVPSRLLLIGMIWIATPHYCAVYIHMGLKNQVQFSSEQFFQ